MYRYIGNKSAIIEPLLKIITSETPPGSRFLDPMCGTASVSAALAQAGYLVTAGDILTFPRYHAEVRLRMSSEPNFQVLGRKYATILEELNSLAPVRGYFWNEYSDAGNPAAAEKPRRYFTPDNALKLDAIDQHTRLWRDSNMLSESEWMLLRHDLIMAANRVANIAGTYGHYRSSHSKASLTDLNLRPSSFNSWATSENSVVEGPAESVARSLDVEVLYLDPPYTKRQYGANYHLLETLAIGDNPDPVGESGLRDWWPQYSDFCSKKKVVSAFADVLGGQNYKKAFVSYSEDGLLEQDLMHSMLETFGEVRLHTIEHKRFRSNQSPLARSISEYVFEVSAR
jgi:adenine-specific DNA-methyltransferase